MEYEPCYRIFHGALSINLECESGHLYEFYVLWDIQPLEQCDVSPVANMRHMLQVLCVLISSWSRGM